MSEILNSSSISKFYAGRSVFVTGVTGFMGKILVEKLLRSCPDIGKIYLLMRPLKGQNINIRLSELCNNQVSFHIFALSFLLYYFLNF